MTNKNEILVAALYKFEEIDDLLTLQSNLYEIYQVAIHKQEIQGMFRLIH